jgi:hypothetical protein
MMTQTVVQPTEPFRPAVVLENFANLAHVKFDDLPHVMVRQAYGERYAELQDVTGGRIWVNRHGWKHLRQLHPAEWYFDDEYYHRGTRLSKGSGAVYRVRGNCHHHVPIDLVVKFSRMAQEVQLDMPSSFPAGIPRQSLDNISFNDPFQEFALVEQLRSSKRGPVNSRILTKRPLAIYSPAKRFQPWRLGRTEGLFRRHDYGLRLDAANQDTAVASVDLSIDRQYIMLFHWVRGVDAEELLRRGQLSTAEVEGLVRDVVDDLSAKGFHVLDTKPNHIILRTRRDNRLLRRNGRLVYAIVDFELLQRKPS